MKSPEQLDRPSPDQTISPPFSDTFRHIGEAIAAGLVKNGPQPPPGVVISPITGFGDIAPVGKRRREPKVVTAMEI